MIITQATITHLDYLIPLFDSYGMFYKQKSDYTAVRKFLNTRLTNKDSIIYLVFIDDSAVGFMQLYFLLSSVSMIPMYVLNDLYIHSDYRNKGIGSALIDKAKSLCIEKGYKRIVIQTENHNPAQHLYQREGFVKDVDLSFFWTNNIA